jgi:nitroimidazol reductase NimA-like FMN-containing flavoprotein (pyridoxamine 5'-phosphate oxidase superfamily)
VRKKQLEITDKSEITKILETTRVGRLATLGEDGYPYITPVNYVYFQESVYIH